MRFLVHDYAGHPFQVQLSRELARRGHEVLHAYAGALQTPRGDLARQPDDPATFASTEVAMHPDYPKAKYSFVKRRSMEVAYGKQVAQLITQWKPDTVLSGNTPTEPQESIQQATRRLGARFVMWHQDFYSIAVDQLVRKKLPVVGGLIGGYYKFLEKRQLRRSDHVVAITGDFTPIMTEQFGVDRSRISVIPNWAPIDTLPALPKDNAWAREQGLADKFVFLYTGTLGMKHNPDLLLQLALAHRKNTRIQLVITSEGIGADWLSQKAREHGLSNLRILPYQPFQRMPEVLATGDVLLAVLEEDAGVFSVPSKVLTYLCAGRPLLLSVPLVNLAARTVTTENAGLCVPPSDVPAFLAAAQSLLDDPAAAAALGRHARAYAERTFDIARIATRFESLLAGRPFPSQVHASIPQPA